VTQRPASRSHPADRAGASSASPGDLVATVAGTGIHVERVERRLAELRRGPRARHIPPDGPGGPPDVRRWVVQELVTEAVLDHETRALGVDDVTSLVAVITADVTVPESEARAYYERNADLYRHPESRSVSHVIAPDEGAARAGAALLGEPEGEAGATVHDVRRGELAGPLEEAIFSAEPGDVVGPIRTELGWHVARVEAITPAFATPFGDVRRGIEDELLLAARSRAFDEWLERRRGALVRIEPQFEHPGHPSRGLPSHRH
jgi:[acyl-carrier-protein] S-malonyltransferase